MKRTGGSLAPRRLIPNTSSSSLKLATKKLSLHNLLQFQRPRDNKEQKNRKIKGNRGLLFLKEVQYLQGYLSFKRLIKTKKLVLEDYSVSNRRKQIVLKVCKIKKKQKKPFSQIKMKIEKHFRKKVSK